MKKLFLILFLMINQTSASENFSELKNCQQFLGKCEYYLCREKLNPCGKKGYVLNFGYKFCQKTKFILNLKLSKKGKMWSKKTSICLQEKLDQINLNYSCQEIKKIAIEGHDECYVNNNFCDLSFLDQLKISKLIFPQILNKSILKEGLQIVKSCKKN